MFKKTFFVVLACLYISGCLPKSMITPSRTATTINWGDSPHRISYVMLQLGIAPIMDITRGDLTYKVKVSETTDILCVYTFKNHRLRTAGYILLGSLKYSGYSLSDTKVPMPAASERTVMFRNAGGIFTFVDKQFQEELNAIDSKRLKERELSPWEKVLLGYRGKGPLLTRTLRK